VILSNYRWLRRVRSDWWPCRHEGKFVGIIKADTKPLAKTVAILEPIKVVIHAADHS
jgi:hypothetical protein